MILQLPEIKIKVPMPKVKRPKYEISFKPKIKIWRNFRGEAIWQCVGACKTKRYAVIGRGDSPTQAFYDWQEACDFPF